MKVKRSRTDDPQTSKDAGDAVRDDMTPGGDMHKILREFDSLSARAVGLTARQALRRAFGSGDRHERVYQLKNDFGYLDWWVDERDGKVIRRDRQGVLKITERGKAKIRELE